MDSYHPDACAQHGIIYNVQCVNVHYFNEWRTMGTPFVFSGCFSKLYKLALCVYFVIAFKITTELHKFYSYGIRQKQPDVILLGRVSLPVRQNEDHIA